jgi:hypothetical protein
MQGELEKKSANFAPGRKFLRVFGEDFDMCAARGKSHGGAVGVRRKSLRVGDCLLARGGFANDQADDEEYEGDDQATADDADEAIFADVLKNVGASF